MAQLRNMLVPVIGLLAISISAQETPRSNYPVVNASGRAEIKVTPDMATVRVGVEAQGATAIVAQNSVNTAAQKIVTAALKIAGDPKFVQTSDLSLQPLYNSKPNEAQKITGYQARNVVIVRLEDVTKVGPLIDAATKVGATNIDSIDFGLKNDRAARKAALKLAVQEAREKAEAMADGLGMKVGEVETIDEDGSGPYARGIMNAGARPGGFEAFASAPVMSGELTLTASVTVRFRLVK